MTNKSLSLNLTDDLKVQYYLLDKILDTEKDKYWFQIFFLKDIFKLC